MHPYLIPLVWAGFAVLIAGSLYKLVSTAMLASRERTVYPTFDARHGLRSIGHWLLPFGSRNMRLRPLFTILSFAFHLCLLITPLFAIGHAVLWKQHWGVSWWSLPSSVADVMTLVVVTAGLFLLVRRIAAPEVRNVSSWADFAIMLLVLSPFATGFLARRHWLDYDLVITLHIVTGVLWLAAIPFTRLAHMLWFLISRAYMGSEFGAVRHARDW